MSKIKTYDTYTEIPNGLFRDIENEKNLTLKDGIEEVLKSIVERDNIIYSPDREMIFFSSAEGARQFNRAVQEEISAQLNGNEASFIVGSDPISDESISNSITAMRNSHEGIWHQLRNMSEQEIIQHFDTISNEEQ